MKALFTVLCISIAFVSFSQDEDKMVEAMMTAPGMKIESTSVKIQKESRPALAVHVNGDAGDIEKGWKKYLARQCDCDLKKEKSFLQSLGVSVPAVSLETVSIFTRVEDDNTGAQIVVAIDFGGKFMSDGDTPNEASNMRGIMTRYLKEFYGGQYEDVIRDQQKAHDKLAKEHGKLIKEGEKLQKLIGNENNDISKAESGTIKAEKDIADLQAKLIELAAEIEQSKSEIDRLQKEVKKNEAVGVAKKEEVDAQKAIVNDLQKQANSITNK